MGIGNELLELKRAAQSAQLASAERRLRGAGWFLLSWLVGGITVMSGLVFAFRGLRHDSLMLFVGSAAAFAAGIFLFFLPQLIENADKELKRLNKIASEAADSYLNALLAEAATYGIDHEVRSERTNFMDPDYEFTSLRNGEPLDVTIREFNDEIVFMLNGERMQKPVTV